MKDNSFLIDITKCMGCRGCQVACKQWNELVGEKTTNTGSHQNPPILSAKTWTLIKFDEVEKQDGVKWFFTKIGCMHCKEPACASACPVGALEKTESGAVIYHDKICIGCRYCMMACPFRIPTFEWDKAFPYIRKCTFCFDRQSEGEIPACAKACPTGAICFGDRDAMIKKGKELIANHPEKYNPHLYGEKEVGGTAVLYLAPKDVEFADLGLPVLDERPLPTWTYNALKYVPGQIVVVGAAMSAFYWLTKRKTENKAESKEVKHDE
ncbi:MAG TPA: 4Fe-4S dicluster domain-containing protein [bacterium]|nr:4Fe-4S dicluster domain-containing protein [bacterium]